MGRWRPVLFIAVVARDSVDAPGDVHWERPPGNRAVPSYTPDCSRMGGGPGAVTRQKEYHPGDETSAPPTPGEGPSPRTGAGSLRVWSTDNPEDRVRILEGLGGAYRGHRDDGRWGALAGTSRPPPQSSYQHRIEGEDEIKAGMGISNQVKRRG